MGGVEGRGMEKEKIKRKIPQQKKKKKKKTKKENVANSKNDPFETIL